MIPITAKSKEAFRNICKLFNIDETEAFFVDSTIREPEPPFYSRPIYETNVKRDCSDWVDYRSFS